MIYPTRGAVILAGAGALVALVVAAMMPTRWSLALAWPMAVLLLCLVDAWRSRSAVELVAELPLSVSVGEMIEVPVSASLRAGYAPPRVQIALDGSPLVRMSGGGRMTLALDQGRGTDNLTIDPVRRGLVKFSEAWVRWTGPLGLAWKQVAIPLNATLAILPDLRPVRQRGAQIFQRHALQGLIAQLERGEGSDLDSLVEFRQGMDRRSIDWKQSARHTRLLARQFRSERNNQIVFAVDCGRQMSEPVAGLPRVDRAVSAALLTAWVALKMGDRVALHAFDSRPRLGSGFISGSGAFADLERMSADIEYSAEETNYTFALTALGAKLVRRSMIVLFTEFTDMVSADFLVRAAKRLVETHLIIIVVLRDEELEEFVDREPVEADDVARAVTAAELLRNRRLVISSLQHAGVHVIESPHAEVGGRLVEGYIDLKRRNLL